jgi:uncharacterized protein (DUF433 family)
MIDWFKCSAVESKPSRMSGAWVFRGIRFPISTLFENLEGSTSPAQFVEWFEGVTIEQIQDVLRFVQQESLLKVFPDPSKNICQSIR